MSTTAVSNATGRLLSWPSGNWERPILGRVTSLMGTPHYYFSKYSILDWEDWFKAHPEHADKKWLMHEQAYALDGKACKEFALSLINVTDDVINLIHPFTHTFIGSPQELKENVVWEGKRYIRLKKGYHCLS